MKTITYIYRGLIEVGCMKHDKFSYRWVEGYSEDKKGAVVYPWMMMRECRADAKSRGAKSKFIREV